MQPESTIAQDGGFAYYFKDGTKLPVDQWVHLMITVSDNTATMLPAGARRAEERQRLAGGERLQSNQAAQRQRNATNSACGRFSASTGWV